MTDFVVISDIHANHLINKFGVTNAEMIYKVYLSKIQNISEKILLCAGDVSNDIEGWAFAYEYMFSNFKHVFLVLGNHDFHATTGTTEDKIAELKNLVSTWSNVTLLDGDVVDFNGIMIGGCFGWYDGLDVEDPTDVLEWVNTWYDGIIWNWHNQNLPTIAYENESKMKKVLDQKPDIFITHVAHEKCNTNPIYAHFRTNKYFYYTSNEYDFSGVKKVICGHIHDAVKTSHDGYDILCNPFGYIDVEKPFVLNNLSMNDFEFSM